MSASANILNLLNTRNGIQHRDYQSGLKAIFVQGAAGLTGAGSAYGATILAQSNALSNDEIAYQDQLKSIWFNFGTALNALGQTTPGATLITYTQTNPISNEVYFDQLKPLVLAIYNGLVALGQ